MRVLLAEDEPGIAAHLPGAGAGRLRRRSVPRRRRGQFLGDTEPYDAVCWTWGFPGATGCRAARLAGRGPALSGADPDRPRQLAREGRGHRRRCGRLSGQALRHRGVAGPLAWLLRRMAGHAEPTIWPGALALDTRTMPRLVGRRSGQLTAMEYRVLAYLMHRPGRIVSQAELTEHVYAQDFDRDLEHDRGHDRSAAQEARPGDILTAAASATDRRAR